MNKRRAIRNKGAIAAARVQRTPAAGPRLNFRIDPLTRKLFRPLVIALVSTSVSLALLVIIRIISPDRLWLALIPLCFIATLEGTYTTAWLNNPDSYGVDRAVYRATEILLLVIVARVYSWTVFGVGIPSPEELRIFLTSPLALFEGGGFITSTFLILIAWGLSVSLTRIFSRLDVSIYEINFYTLSPSEQKAKADDRPIQTARDHLLASYISTWLTLGMLMVLLAALSTFEVGQFSTVPNPFEITRLGLSPAMLYALMVYFLGGFWLLSHARLLRMNARWLMDGVAKDAEMERKWQRNSLVILLGIGLAAAFLPIGSTLAISQILRLGLSGIGYLSAMFFSLLGNAFVRAFMGLTGNNEDNPQQPPEYIPQTPITPETAPPATPDPLLTMIISSAFWAIVIAVVIAATLYFLRERGYSIDKVRLQRSWQSISAWLRSLIDSLSGRARSARRRLQASLTRTESSPLRPSKAGSQDQPRFIRLAALSPREQVRFYYLALIRRAGEQGVKRRASDTPLEYADELKNAWPDAEADLDEMTHAFLEARYSPQPLDKREATSIKARWKALRSRLKPRK